MAGMAVAVGSRAAMVPAVTQATSTSRSRGGWDGGAAAKKVNGFAFPVMAVRGAAGMGRVPLRFHSKGVAKELKRPITVAAAKTEIKTELSIDEQTEVQIEGTKVQEVAEDVLKRVKESWSKIDDKLAIGGLGFIGLVALWGSTGLISAIDRLPLIPQFLEIVGLVFTGWFVYRYVLFKPDREELFKVVDDTKSRITGQDL